MRWKMKLLLLFITAIPSFSGFPLKQFSAEVVPGFSWSWAVYLLGNHLIIRALLGRYRYGKITGVAALITLPVVYSGAGLSFILWIVKGGSQADAFNFGSHYLNLTVNMLTVIPLSLAIVILLPFSAFEQQLLQCQEGVSPMEKRLLMAMRVFNHIVFDVLPTILEVLREERYPDRKIHPSHEYGDGFSLKRIYVRLIRMNSKMVQIGVEGICAAIQYIPLWAVEISELPQRKKAAPKK